MAALHTSSAKSKLHGRYRVPRFRIDAKVLCEVRGELRIVGITDARIPWPLGVGARGGATFTVPISRMPVGCCPGAHCRWSWRNRASDIRAVGALDHSLPLPDYGLGAFEICD
jgi:hypothetical protein